MAFANRVDGRWDVAIAASLAAFFGIATSRSSGWFYVVFMENFGVDRRGASWPSSVHTIMFRSSGIFIGVLQQCTSLFWIGILGSFLLWGGLIASAFATDIVWLTVTIGLMHGLGSGLVLISNLVQLMHYFEKYRGLATGIKYCSDPLSAIVFPPVLVYLESTYGLGGTLLVYGALTMHATAFSILLKEAPWLKSSREGAKRETHALDALRPTPSDAKRHPSRNGRLCRIIRSLPSLPPELRTPSFYVATLGAALIDYINVVHLSTIVDYALDMGVPRIHAELTVTYAAAPEMAGRILLPLVADLGIVTRPVLTAVVLLVLGVLLAVTPHTTSAAHIAVRVASSVAVGTSVTMKQVHIADYFGPAAVSLVSGSSTLILLPLLLCNPLIIGHFRDVTGSYDNLYRILAGVVLAMAATFMFLICNQKKCRAVPSHEADGV